MRILINTATTFNGGGLQVANSFIEECKNYGSNIYFVILSLSLKKFINIDSFPKNFHFYNIYFRPSRRVLSFKSQTSFFYGIENEIHPDFVFTTTGPAYWRPKAPHLVGFNTPHHVYPDSPYFKELSLFKNFEWQCRKAITKFYFKKDSDAVVVQTDDVKKRLRMHFKMENVYTVQNTCSGLFYNLKKHPNKLPKRNKHEFRFLTLSAWYPHKNFEIIIPVIDALPSDIKYRTHFILTLPMKIYENLFPKKYRNYIYNLGPVHMEECPSVYEECDALFLPTLLECFSASYPEAMAMNKPILTSDLGFARCVCKDAALYFNPMDPIDIAKKITMLIKSEKTQEKLRLNGRYRLLSFGTAKSRAERYLNLCDKIYKQKI